MNDYPIAANAETIRLITFSASNLVEARWLGDTRSRDHGMELAIGFARYTPTYTFAIAVGCRIWDVGSGLDSTSQPELSRDRLTDVIRCSTVTLNRDISHPSTDK